MILTTVDHDGDDYAPHVDAPTTDDGAAILTYWELVAYVRELESFDRNCGISADDVTLAGGVLSLYLPDYDDTETYAVYDHNGHDGQTRYVVGGGWLWQAYAGPCEDNDH